MDIFICHRLTACHKIKILCRNNPGKRILDPDHILTILYRNISITVSNFRHIRKYTFGNRALLYLLFDILQISKQCIIDIWKFFHTVRTVDPGICLCSCSNGIFCHTGKIKFLCFLLRHHFHHRSLHQILWFLM